MERSNDDSRPLILHVIHHFKMGGMENGLVNLINNLPVAKYRHAVACIEDYSDFRRRLTRTDVEIVALDRSRVGTWRMRYEIFRMCRRMRPALVHTRNQSGLDALLPARLAGVSRCIHGEHGWDVDNLSGRKWKPALLRRIHSPLVCRYVVVSQDLKEFLVNRIGIDPSRIVQIYNGVDTNRFSPAIAKPIRVLPPELRSDGLVRIGTVGRLQAVKDQQTLLRAFAQLLSSEPAMRDRVRLVIVGDGPLLQPLRMLAESLGISPFTWFSGAIENVPDLLATLDLFVLPSLNEGVSNTLLEAMACGIPIAATAVGGSKEIVQDERFGRLFQPGDVETLGRILSEYVENAARRQAHGRAARQAAMERFSLSAMLTSYQATYDLLLRGNGPPGIDDRRDISLVSRINGRLKA